MEPFQVVTLLQAATIRRTGRSGFQARSSFQGSSLFLFDEVG